jgi:hypothetical protein
MTFKTTFNKLQGLTVLFLLSITFANAQTSLPYSTDFENGTDGWIDGGGDSQRVTNNGFSPQGNDSWEIKDNSGTASSFYQNFDLTDYATVTIAFSFQTDSFDDSNDLFEVQLDNNILLTYRYTQDWTRNGRVYNATVTLNSSDYTFTNNSRVRFETAGSTGNNDKLYIDEISITGTKRQVAPTANFAADNTTPFTGDTVTFSDSSTNNPTSWSWSFSGTVSYVNGTSSSSQNPQVMFSTAGSYTITLTASNTSGSDNEIKTDYIIVTTPISNPTSFTAITSTQLPYTVIDLSVVTSPNFNNILIAYSTTNSFGDPSGLYSNNDIINGGGTVIYIGNANGLNPNVLPQLNQNATYYFKAWSIGNNGYSSGLIANATTAAVEAPISFTAKASTTSNNVTFSATSNSLNNNLMLVYNTSNDFDIPVDGEFYTDGDYIGNAMVLLYSVNVEHVNNFVQSRLLSNTTYYYQLYSLVDGIWYYSQSNINDDTTTIGSSIWQNNISDSNPSQDNPYTNGDQVNPNITVSGISRSGGVGANGRSNEYSATNWSTLPDIDTNKYFEFTLSPNLGHEINLLTFNYSGDDGRGNNINQVAVRSSIDNYESDILGSLSGDSDPSIDLSGAAYQNITGTITFRIYGWDADDDTQRFSIRDFSFEGTVTDYCVWSGTSWSNTTGPTLSHRAVIDGDYNTSTGGYQTSFSCKALTINGGKILKVNNSTFVEVIYNTTVNGELVVETKGAFIQKDNNGIFINNGTSKVNKITPNKNAWYYYTYWSSPVKNMNIENVFPGINRKFYFDGTNWQYATGKTMEAGKGYITTAPSAGIQTATFVGEFNTGTITTPIVYDIANNIKDNLIGNPYPSSIDLNQFLAANNGVIEGIAYFWSQETAPVGGQFSGADYIPYNTIGGVSTSIDPTRALNGFVPSGQSFFIISKATGSATFTNAMRMADVTSNSQFFKSSNTKSKASTTIDNKLWVNLKSNNGVFSQILVGYTDGATNEDDGLAYDATKFDEGSGAYLYSTIENSKGKFVIQGKDVLSINKEEVIKLGFKTNISIIATTYTVSVAKLQGDFISGNSIYLKDKLLNIIHDLSSNDYTFSSEVGEFNNRFEIVFSAQALSTNALTMDQSDLKIIELNNDFIQFSVPSTLSIKKVNVFDLLGKYIVDFKGNSSNEKHHFYNLDTAIYIAEVTLNNGDVIKKKFIKK